MMFSSLVKIVSNAGYAINTTGDVTYQYVDLWSRQTTWGNNPPPREGDSVVISEGQTVMLDTSPPRLYIIIVLSGTLVFDPTTDIFLAVSIILINYGRLAIGDSIDKPYTKKATIQLWGDRLSPELPISGAKVIFMRNGRVDIHGIPRKPVWTRINGTIAPGASSFFTKEIVDWVPGEEIVVSSTDFEPLHYERFYIASVVHFPSIGNSLITVNGVFTYQHYGVRQCFSDSNRTVCIDEIAEVVLLTRNIVLEGDPDTPINYFGATLFMMICSMDECRTSR